MVELGTAAVLGKLLISVTKAWLDDDFELDDDGWAAVQQFMGATPTLQAIFGDEVSTPMAAKLMVLSLRAFREALRRHWAGSELAVPDRVRFWHRWTDKYDRKREIELCIQSGLDKLVAGSSASTFELPELCLDQPTLSPIYVNLFEAFRDLGDVEPPLLDVSRSGARVEFDGLYRGAWRELLVSSEFAELGRWLELSGQAQRGERVRSLLLGNLEAWTSTHIFAAAHEIRDLGWMPPEDFYIEPRGHLVDFDSVKGRVASEGVKLRSMIELGLNSHQVVLVTADFGYGKSLTAKTLAAQWARQYSDSRSTSRTPLPVYVPCGALDWHPDRLDVKSVVRSAWMHQVDALTGLKLDLDDPALEPPSLGEPATVILDGLDEARFDGDQINSLLTKICSASSRSGWRFVLFFRPGLLSAIERIDRFAEIKILPFDRVEIETWIHRWNFVTKGPALRYDDIAALEDVINVPILLFMVAYQWGHGPETALQKRHTIYESFALALARGKLAVMGERSPRLAAAARRFARALGSKLGPLRSVGGETDTSDSELALLWLMGRVAWLGYRYDADMSLGTSEHDIDAVLNTELGYRVDDVDFCRVTLLICMQARIEEHREARYLFFGHRSFHEFFVARFWRDSLLRLAVDEHAVERILLEGSLVPIGLSDDQAMDFLLELLSRLNKDELKRIEEWARKVAYEQSPDSLGMPFPADKRWHDLRLAALRIYCHLAAAPTLSAEQFRSILAKMWITGTWRRVSCAGLHVSHASLSFADLTKADLRRCKFDSLTVEHSRLHAADLSEAHLNGAYFGDTDLSDVSLSRSEFHDAIFERNTFLHVNVTGSVGANVQFSSMLVQGSFFNCSLVSSTFTDIRMESTAFCDVELSGAKFVRVDFSYVDFGSADLTRVTFSDCRCDSYTTWPVEYGGEPPCGVTVWQPEPELEHDEYD